MNSVQILLDNLNDWKPYYETSSILSVSDYLKNKSLSKGAKLVINLSNNYSYNSEGYYSSLLGQARGQKVIPSVDVLNKLESGAGMRMDQALQKLCYQWIQKNNIQEEFWTLDIYFGTCQEKGLEKIARYIFDYYSAPILRVTFNKRQKNQIESIQALYLKDLNETSQDIFANALDNFNKKVWRVPRQPKAYKYNLAILHDPNEKFPPSDKKAIQKFIEVGKKMEINVELITEEDSMRLLEFDALFIRSTTSLNHFTYQFAEKAEQNGLVVIDDPTSIIRCTNKVYLSELLAKEKILAPASMLVFRSNENSYQEIGDRLGFPFILKIPDGSFSHGVKKVSNSEEFLKATESLFSQSAIILAQEYIPTDFDWRIGILNGEPLYACKYFMAKGHWQIYQHLDSGKSRCGMTEAVPIYKVPQSILRTALKATSLIGKGLYGVDMKMVNNKAYIIEINDNPSIDYTIEDAILGDDLYYRILNYFVLKIEQVKF